MVHDSILLIAQNSVLHTCWQDYQQMNTEGFLDHIHTHEVKIVCYSLFFFFILKTNSNTKLQLPFLNISITKPLLLLVRFREV